MWLNGRTDGQTDGKTDRETDMTKLIVALRNFENPPNNSLLQSETFGVPVII
jgi:Fe-S-cluster formation regulator IscX/YfhJ